MVRELQTLNEQNKLALWAERVQACRSSGRTVKDWCKESGISEQTVSVLETPSYNYLRQTHMGLPLNIFRLAFYWLWHVIRDVKI